MRSQGLVCAGIKEENVHSNTKTSTKFYTNLYTVLTIQQTIHHLQMISIFLLLEKVQTKHQRFSNVMETQAEKSASTVHEKQIPLSVSLVRMPSGLRFGWTSATYAMKIIPSAKKLVPMDSATLICLVWQLRHFQEKNLSDEVFCSPYLFSSRKTNASMSYQTFGFLQC